MAVNTRRKITPDSNTASNKPNNGGPRADPARYPEDRRQTVWVRPSLLLTAGAIVLLFLIAAWGQYLLIGLPYVHVYTPAELHNAKTPSGFPIWLRLAHYANFLLMMLIIRSGLSILWDHPRLYGNVHCSPKSEWARFTPLAVPTDRLWTANDDQRYLPPWLGLPGYKHTVGMARQWHFVCDLLWIATGSIYVIMILVSGHLLRLAPTSWQIVPQAWDTFVYYATLHLPPEPDGFYAYNALQQIAYFGVVFVLAPLSLLTGVAMSPALDSRFPWYPRLFGGRQRARSLHFLLLLGYVVFIVIHVTLVFATGGARNMNHIVLGKDDTGPLGLIVGAVGIAVVVGACVAAHWIAWNRPRIAQLVARRTVGAIERSWLNGLVPRAEYGRGDISPRFWPNGSLPTSDEWLKLGLKGYEDYRLRVYGMVENPVELSLDQLRAMAKQEQTTLHNCIQGWSGIAEWGGLPMAALIDLVRPEPDAKVAAFYSFGNSHSGRQYYDTHTLVNLRHAQSLLAYEMNYETLSDVYGAPLRLRVENQLGYKMVKWIKAIEFVRSEKDVGAGFGGVKEDEEYFDLLANI
jgi:methionine sulfoxide reductase catalytic subunit